LAPSEVKAEEIDSKESQRVIETPGLNASDAEAASASARSPIGMPLHFYGFAAGILITYQLAEVRNIFTIGGGAVLGAGVGGVICPLVARILRSMVGPISEPFLRKAIYMLVGFIGSEIVNVGTLIVLAIIDSTLRTRILTMGFDNLAVVVHIPVAFWLFYLWDYGFKRMSSSSA
jgi:hypothetical protein